MIILFFLAAIVYASVGLGGGSTYIALLAAFGVSHTEIPQLSLLCNLVVVSGGCFHLFRSGHGNLRRLVPLLVASIPAAFIGGHLPVSKEIFMTLLSLTLMVAGIRLVMGGQLAARMHRESRHPWRWGLGVGGILGLLSGIVGIGGGIFLSPVLYFLRWDDAKGIAAATSLFILLNSASGLVGQVMKTGVMISPGVALPLLLAVLVGGQVGSLLAVHRFSHRRIRQLTGVFVLSVAVQLMWKGVA